MTLGYRLRGNAGFAAPAEGLMYTSKKVARQRFHMYGGKKRGIRVVRVWGWR